MDEIEQYAVDLVFRGAGHYAQDDMDEDGVFEDEDDWRRSRNLGRDMALVIEGNQESFLAWYRQQGR